jgi:hypothetical protein
VPETRHWEKTTNLNNKKKFFKAISRSRGALGSPPQAGKLLAAFSLGKLSIVAKK